MTVTPCSWEDMIMSHHDVIIAALVNEAPCSVGLDRFALVAIDCANGAGAVYNKVIQSL